MKKLNRYTLKEGQIVKVIDCVLNVTEIVRVERIFPSFIGKCVRTPELFLTGTVRFHVDRIAENEIKASNKQPFVIYDVSDNYPEHFI